VVIDWKELKRTDDEAVKKQQESQHDTYWAAIWCKNIIPLVFGIIFTVWLVGEIAESTKIVINPEYYAIKDLLTIVLKPGR
ncbi:MAG: hypothetical protein Q8R12_03950, partial [bacterium]|nr:hypothetical protein [bacterium]